MTQPKLRARWLAPLAAIISLTAGSAWALPFNLEMAKHPSGYYKGANAVVLPMYSVTYITGSQATAVGGGARARLNAVLAGVDEATMRKLADEAHADLRAQFAAAGFPVATDEQAQAMIAANTIPLVAGNRDEMNAEGGITVNKSLRQSYVTFGAKAAPLLEPYKPVIPGGMMLGHIPFSNRLAKGQADGMLAVIPTLVIDFANLEASVSSNSRTNSATAGGRAAFSIRAASNVMFIKAYGKGRAFPFLVRPQWDYGTPTPFSTQLVGGADVRPLNYMGQSVARGDAVIVNLPAWENLVRAAYRDYNRAIVAGVVKGK